MNRRELIAVLGAAAVSWPLRTLAQQRSRRLNVMATLRRARAAHARASMACAGAHGRARCPGTARNLAIKSRFGEGREGAYPQARSGRLQLKVDVIVASGTPGVEGTRQATATTPIVMVNTGDPVGSGFVQSFSRPGQGASQGLSTCRST